MERVARLHLVGELTIYRANALKADLLGAIESSDELHVDLSRVTDIDTSAVQLLLLAKREMVAKGGKLHLTGHTAPVVDAFDLYGVGSQFGDPVLLREATMGVEP